MILKEKRQSCTLQELIHVVFSSDAVIWTTTVLDFPKNTILHTYFKITYQVSAFYKK